MVVSPKFKVGDKVRVNKRAPEYVFKGYRQMTRTIVNAFYDPDKQCCYYELGARGKSTMGYWFRGYMLTQVTKKSRHKIGKPKTKHKYIQREATLKPIIIGYLQQQGYFVKDEVYLNHHFVDLIATKNGNALAIELKWKYWQVALKQALQNKPYVTCSYVALPADKIANIDLDEFHKAGIGLISIDIKNKAVAFQILLSLDKKLTSAT